jgi:Ion channel
MYVTVAAVCLSVASNLALAWYGFAFKPDTYSGSIWTCYKVVVAVAIAFPVIFAAFCFRDSHGRKIGPVWTLLALMLQTAAIIFVFAGVYRGYGLKVAEHGTELADWKTPLYFSMVTLTTLGYGDVTPASGIRLIAAIQALLGYLNLGLIVGVASELINARE